MMLVINKFIRLF